MTAIRHLRPIDTLLSRLEGVKQHGKGYRARCPACGGISAKLSVSEADTGSVLLHCFGGCVPADVLAAVDLRLGDLFPERLRPMTDAERREAREHARMAQWQAALPDLCKAAAILQLAQRELASGRPLSAEDLACLRKTEDRIADARNVLCPPVARFRPEARR